MSEVLIAYCGLDCSACGAYKVAQSGDAAAAETLAARWATLYRRPDATARDVVCDGCTSDGRLWLRCRACPVRVCCRARGLAHCAQCSDYPCALVEALAREVPDVRVRLEVLREKGVGDSTGSPHPQS